VIAVLEKIAAAIPVKYARLIIVLLATLLASVWPYAVFAKWKVDQLETEYGRIWGEVRELRKDQLDFQRYFYEKLAGDDRKATETAAKVQKLEDQGESK
jgi:hypothetical protein